MIDPEFKVERRDSLGMVAKEYTQNLMEQMGDKKELETDDHNKSLLEKEREENKFFEEETFAGSTSMRDLNSSANH